MRISGSLEMKLKIVYVWIKNFKNIEREGFNLSGDFYIDKTENNKFLIKKFNNIACYSSFINIKAFVGKNGSGKSAILEFLLLYLSNLKNISEHLEGFLLLLDEDKKVFYVKNMFKANIELNDDIKENYKLKEIEESSLELEQYLYNIYINYAIDYLSTTFWEIIESNNLRLNKPFYINKKNNFVLSPIKSWNKINVDIIHKEFANDYFFIRRELNLSDERIKKLIEENFEDENFTFYPEKFKLGLNKIKYTFKIEGILTSKENINIDYLFRAFKEKDFDLFILNKENMGDTKKKLILLGLIYIYLQYKPRQFNQKNEYDELFYKIYKYLTILTQNFSEHLYNEVLKIVSSIKNIDMDSLREIFYHWKENLKIYKSDEPVIKYMEYVFNTKNSIRSFLEYEKYDPSDDFLIEYLPDFMDLYLIDQNGRKFTDLSFGEKLLNFLLLKILRIIKEAKDKYKSEINTINILYDEFDIGLHPEMQRKFINFITNITKLVNEYFNNKLFFNIIISTHSPFIISDIPKNNISFIKDGKEKEEFKENENTFGANLYDILAKGFFLKNSIGLYSEKFIKSLSTILALVFAIKYYEKYKDSFLLRRLEEQLRKDLKIEKNINEIKQNFNKFLEENNIIEEELLSFFVKRNENNNKMKIDEILQQENIKYYIENLIGEPIIRKNLEDILEKIENL